MVEVVAGIVGVMEEVSKEVGARRVHGALAIKAIGALAASSQAGATKGTGGDKLTTTKEAHGMDRCAIINFCMITSYNISKVVS